MSKRTSLDRTSLKRLALFLPLVLLVASLACTMPAIRKPGATSLPPTPTSTQPPLPTATQRPLPPALVESDPPSGSEVALGGLITLYFNQPMDRPSVESAIKVRAFLISDLIWTDDSTVTINPGQDLPPDASLEIDVDTVARASNGQSLLKPISLTYHTPGYLHLAQRLPEPDASDVSPASAIVAAFDHPVVPLGADSASLTPAFTLTPEANGKGEWINTSTYIFYPDPGLEGGVSYTVQVSPTLHGIDGNPLDTTDPWSFTTALPRLETFATSSGDATLTLDGKLTLTFNQPMDSESVAANFRVLDPNGSPIAGELTWNDNHSAFDWQSDDLLARGAVYSAELGGGARGRGGTPLGSDSRYTFTTIPELQVVQTQPTPGGVLDSYNSAQITLSGPIDAKRINDLVNVQPRLASQNVYWEETSRTLFISGFFLPSTQYSLSLSPQISDAWGSTLGGASGQPYVLDFRSAPLPPGVQISGGPDVHFITTQDNAVSAQVNGFTRLPLALGSLPLDDLFMMLGPNGYEFRQNYRPADVHSWWQELNVNPDQAEDVSIYLSPSQEPLPSGMYSLRISFPDQNRPDEIHLILVSDVNATVKFSPTQALVWVVDLKTNAPLPDAPVTVYDVNGNVLTSGQTDKQGLFQGEFPVQSDPYASAVAVVGQPGEVNFGLTISDWSQDIAPWTFQLPMDYMGSHIQGYLYTDRPIYRPGQTVYFRAVVRQAYNGRYQLPELQNIKVQLVDDIGQEIDSLELPLSAYGTIHGEFNLPAGLRPGNYSISMPDLGYSAIVVPVADYRKPEINLQVAFSDDQVLAGENVQADINARYFFDAPAGEVPVRWDLYSSSANFDLPGYSVGLQGASQWYRPFIPGNFGTFFSQGSGETNPDGILNLDLGSLQTEAGRQRYTLEVTAQDESGLPVSNRAIILVNPADTFIGLRSDSWVGRSGDPMGFDVLTVGWDQSPVADRALRAEFSQVTWVLDETQPQDPYSGPTYKPQFTPVSSTDFRTGAEGQARLEFTPPEPGPYQLSVFDPANKAARSEILIWAGGSGQFTLPDQSNRHINLTADKTTYQPGETARIFVSNPFSTDVPALITTERGVILSKELKSLAPGGTTLEFPLTGEASPNVFISVTLLGQDEQNRPDFRQGYLELTVNPVEQTLNVQITRSPEIAGPGDTVNFEILVTDANGEPVQGEFSLAVVDMAALALADPNSVNIVQAFYGEQGLGVRTGLPLSIYAGRNLERSQATGGGGGGGGEVPVLRQNFPDTALWQADIITGADGKAQISVPLPDNLTTWQAETRGVTSDTRVGQTKTEVVTTKDLLVRPVTPRFLVTGDHMQLAAIIQNNTTQTLQGEAALQADGFNLDDPAAAQQPFTLSAGERLRVNWWGTVEDSAAAKLVFSANAQNGAYQDAAQPTGGDLPVLHYSAPQSFRTAGTIDQAEQRLELVSLPRFTQQNSGSTGGDLKVELSPSLAAAMIKALQVLDESECRCTELTLSRFLPNLEIYRTFQQFGLQSPEVQARLENTLDASLQTLLNRQNFDGGWGWWPGGPSDPFMTAYVLFGLGQASEVGVLSAEPPIQRAVDYLNTNLISQELPSENWQLDRLAFAHFALANAGFGQIDPMNTLYIERARLNPWAQALLAVAMENVSPSNEESHTLLSDLQSTAVRSAAGASWDLAQNSGQDDANMATALTNSAIVTYALAQRDPGLPLVADAVRYLVANRQADGGWTSSYTTAWTLIALNEVMKATSELGGDFSFGAVLNDTLVANGQASGTDQLTPVNTTIPLNQLYPDSPNLLSIERGDGTGRLYYSAVLDVSRPAEQVEPLSQGLSVSRQYFPATSDCDSGGCEALQSAQINEKVKVRLTLTVPSDSYYVMVDDYIPAGAEILDTRLKTSQQGPDYNPEAAAAPTPEYDPQNPFREGWGWWYFHEASIYDDHISWSADYLPAGTYELTYTFVPLQAGDYQVLPAHTWELYFPEVQATSAGGKFTIQ